MAELRAASDPGRPPLAIQPGGALTVRVAAERELVTEDVGVVERQLFLRQLMPAATGTMAAQLVRQMRDGHFTPGELVYARGAEARDVVFVVEGTVELRAQGEAPWLFEAPALLGVIDALHDRPHARDAVATSDLRTLSISSDEWFEMLEDHFEIAAAGFRRTSEDLLRMRLASPPDGGFGPAPPPGPSAGALNVIERIRLVQGALSFRMATVQAVASVACVAEEIDLAPGATLFREGEPSDRLHLLASGTIEIVRKDPPIRASFGPGQIVGGAVGGGLPEHPWTAVATTRVVALTVRREDLLDVMEDHVELTRAVMMGISEEREQMFTTSADRVMAGPAQPGPIAGAPPPRLNGA